MFSGVEIWCTSMWIFLNCWRNYLVSWGWYKVLFSIMSVHVTWERLVSTTWLFFIRTVKWCYKLNYSATNQGLSKFQQNEESYHVNGVSAKLHFMVDFSLYNWFLSLRCSLFSEINSLYWIIVWLCLVTGGY